jgi:Beta-propeller repeat
MHLVVKRFWACRTLWQRLIVVAALASVGLLSLIQASRGSKEAPAPVAIARADPAIQSRVAASYGKLPLSFELNAGQTDASVRFLSRGPGYSLFLTRNDAVLSLEKPRHPQIKAPVDLRSGDALFPELAVLLVRPRGPKPSAAVQSERPMQAPAEFRMSLAGANQNAKVTGLDELPGKSNYFIGNDPARWRTNVPAYAKVKYQNVYRGIDLVYYGNPQQLEYDFLVAPGADPKAISLDLAAISSSADGRKSTLKIDTGGDLVIQAGEDEVRLHKPAVYQTAEGSARQFLDGHYLLKSNDRLSFEVASYDPDKMLVIDPVLSYSTYLGGSGLDDGVGIAVDSSGSAYVTGYTLSTNFPTGSPLQSSNSGSSDAFVVKLNPSGSALVYSTYLGGSGPDVGHGIAVDSSGNAYVTGSTDSANFPTASPLQALYGGGGGDAFVAKLNTNGSALVYSTYLGGSADDFGQGIAVDSSGNAYVTGVTLSTDFPTASPLQAFYGGGSEDAFVAKLNPAGSALVYSTYLGSFGSDSGNGIAVDSSGNAYVTGRTNSTNFPTANPLQPLSGGGGDAFVSKLNPSGSALVYSTYLGGSASDEGFGIAVDSSGNAYVTGATQSTNFPTASPLQPLFAGGSDAFVAKLNPSGSALVYSRNIQKLELIESTGETAGIDNSQGERC